jgi:hypothetical protein
MAAACRYACIVEKEPDACSYVEMVAGRFHNEQLQHGLPDWSGVPPLISYCCLLAYLTAADIARHSRSFCC